MTIFVYEWVSGGGMLALEGTMPESLLTEGVAMARAVGEDFAKLPGAEVTLLRDVRAMSLSAAGCRVVGVDSASEHNAELEHHLANSDAVLIIAPETDGHLLRVAKLAEALGARLCSPGSQFIAIAGDKSKTAKALRAAGVPVPQGLTLETDQPMPADFPFPAVLKPVDGAGSEDTYLLADQRETPPPYAWRRRLERYHSGQPASVALLCAGQHIAALLPCEQLISSDGRLRYQGGRAPLAAGLEERAKRLALRAVSALPPTTGYVGVDLVLGANPDGSEDVVVEVNPRLTTSYTGLRFAAQSNLAAAMLACREGAAREIAFDRQPFQFDSAGVTAYE